MIAQHRIVDSRPVFRARLEALAAEHLIDASHLGTLLRTEHELPGLILPAQESSPIQMQAPVLEQTTIAPVSSVRRIPTVLVPGLLGDTVRKLVAPMMCARKNLEIDGYPITVAWVNGRAGCDRNARLLRDQILQITDDTGGKINLIGYSKGCTDSLHLLARHPETHSRIHALVSLCGVVMGTPLAANPSLGIRRLLQYLPLPGEGFGDGRAIVDMAPAYRRQWLQDNPLPSSVHYASIIAAPTPDRVSRVLRGSWRQLAPHSVHNDSQVIDRDSLLPNSELLAVINADHWAAALPIGSSSGTLGPLLGRWLVTRNDFPREWLLQACIDHLSHITPNYHLGIPVAGK